MMMMMMMVMMMMMMMVNQFVHLCLSIGWHADVLHHPGATKASRCFRSQTQIRVLFIERERERGRDCNIIPGVWYSVELAYFIIKHN